MAKTRSVKSTSLEACVKRGAMLLDHEQPLWWKKIDLQVPPQLDGVAMSTIGFCVLGRVFGIYEAGLRELEIEYPVGKRFRYGFTLSDEADLQEWEELARLWRVEIESRERLSRG